eukprot:2121445-Alexandrium_andersonii.AAC.1
MEEDLELGFHREDGADGLVDVRDLGPRRVPAHVEVAHVAAGVQEDGSGVHEGARPCAVAWCEHGPMREVVLGCFRLGGIRRWSGNRAAPRSRVSVRPAGSWKPWPLEGSPDTPGALRRYAGGRPRSGSP